MKRIPIFLRGTHVSSRGETEDFSEDRIRAAVEVYDPALHEAPLCIGHPKDNLPSYGWVKSLSYSDGQVDAMSDQVEPQFAEMVRSGRFKKRSASFYPAGHPSNPVGDKADYLRHVAFLGAQPPAVKGMPDCDFRDQEEGLVVIEFGDWDEAHRTSIIGDTFRRIREYWIANFGKEAADEVVPSYVPEDLNRSAERELADPVPDNESTAFQEATVPNPNEPGQGGGQAGADTTDFAEREAEIQRREQALAERERQTARQELTEFVDKLVTDGKVMPRDKDNLVEFLEAQDAETELEFAEAGEDGSTSKVKRSPRDFARTFLANLPQAIDYGEVAGPGEREVDATVEFSAPPGTTVSDHRARVHARAKHLQRENENLNFAEAAVQADRELKTQEG